MLGKAVECFLTQKICLNVCLKLRKQFERQIKIFHDLTKNINVITGYKHEKLKNCLDINHFYNSRYQKLKYGLFIIL